MNIRKERLLLLFALLLIVPEVFTQNVGSNSPYGRYGYGLLENPSVGGSDAMGGISYGLRRSQHVNPGNPASYSELDTLTFVFDFGVSGHMSRLNDGYNDKRDFYNANIDYVAMQFPLFRNVGASIGLLPYSKAGYNFGSLRSLADGQYVESYRGTGGLNQIYGGIAWEPVKNISIGANVSYLFGNFSYSSVVSPTISMALTQETKSMYSIRDIKFDMGLQATYPISQQQSMTLGVVYSPKLSTTSDVNLSTMMYEADPYNNPGIYPSQILVNDTLKDVAFSLPHTFGAGVTYNTKNFTIGLDGTYQAWKGMSYPNVLDELNDDERFNNVFRVNAGVEYVMDPYSPAFFQRVRFRGGFYYTNSYVNMNVYNPDDADAGRIGVGSFQEYGVTVGVGLPMFDLRTRRMSMLNVGFGYSRQQSDTQYMINQDMFKVSVSMNINELWFLKHQFN